jgi:hypothetical protein
MVDLCVRSKLKVKNAWGGNTVTLPGVFSWLSINEQKENCVQLSNCHLIYLRFDITDDILKSCEEQVKSKKRLGWKHGNTPRRFFMAIKERVKRKLCPVG